MFDVSVSDSSVVIISGISFWSIWISPKAPVVHLAKEGKASYLS